jgi:hypothetical protein
VNCNIVSSAALLIGLFNKIPEGRTCSKASRCGWGAGPPSTSRPALPPTRVNGDVAAVSRHINGDAAAAAFVQVLLPGRQRSRCRIFRPGLVAALPRCSDTSRPRPNSASMQSFPVPFPLPSVHEGNRDGEARPWLFGSDFAAATFPPNQMQPWSSGSGHIHARAAKAGLLVASNSLRWYAELAHRL